MTKGRVVVALVALLEVLSSPAHTIRRWFRSLEDGSSPLPRLLITYLEDSTMPNLAQQRDRLQAIRNTLQRVSFFSD